MFDGVSDSRGRGTFWARTPSYTLQLLIYDLPRGSTDKPAVCQPCIWLRRRLSPGSACRAHTKKKTDKRFRVLPNCNVSHAKNATISVFVITQSDVIQFANSGQKHTPGNLEQTRMHNPPHLVSYVRTVPCKIKQRFLRHIQ